MNDIMNLLSKLNATLPLLGLVTCAVACGASAPANKANPCATPGATYLSHFVELSGGTCGPIPDEIMNINSDGTLPQSLSCQTVTQDGCTARNTDCTTNGACTVTTDVTFATDGSSASGLETVSCSTASASCTSTYRIGSTRQ
jgi:hypothetical protein